MSKEKDDLNTWIDVEIKEAEVRGYTRGYTKGWVKGIKYYSACLDKLHKKELKKLIKIWSGK